MVDAVFARLGEDALWNGVGEPVRVRPAERDDFEQFDRAEQIVTVRFLRVRASEVAAPDQGDTVVMLDGDGAPDGRVFVLLAGPRQTRNRIWLCEVDLAPPPPPGP
jgi:hypothetical protein